MSDQTNYLMLGLLLFVGVWFLFGEYAAYRLDLARLQRQGCADDADGVEEFGECAGVGRQCCDCECQQNKCRPGEGAQPKVSFTHGATSVKDRGSLALDTDFKGGAA